MTFNDGEQRSIINSFESAFLKLYFSVTLSIVSVRLSLLYIHQLIYFMHQGAVDTETLVRVEDCERPKTIKPTKHVDISYNRTFLIFCGKGFTPFSEIQFCMNTKI